MLMKPRSILVSVHYANTEVRTV